MIPVGALWPIGGNSPMTPAVLMRATVLLPNDANHSPPSGPEVMPARAVRSVG